MSKFRFVFSQALINKMILPKISFSRTMCQRSLHGASKKLDSIIRVNHAGELGADRIYAGQMAVLGVVK